jgi:peptidoglycan biosynthesis protein MviN/MurJ (putative lipid II flippase)
VEGAQGVAPDAQVRNAAVLSFGHAAVMVLGGVLALLIAHFFGKSARTDAFFAAYGVYAIALVFGQTFRLTALPALVSDRDGSATDRLLAAVCLMSVAAAVPMVLLAGPVGDLLVDNDPSNTTAESLRTLWPALAGQLVIGLLAAVLLVRNRFAVIGFGYVMTGVSSIVVFLALEGALGIQAVSVALGVSACSLAVLFVVTLVQAGWRPQLDRYVRLKQVVGDSWRLLLASTSFVATNLGYVICLAVASREGTGNATLYAYAYFSAALLVATTAVSAAMVRAPALLAKEGPGRLTTANSVSTYRFTLVLVIPALAMAALVGKPVVDFVLGASFDSADAQRLVVTLLCLSGWILGSAAGVLAIVELLRREQIRRLAVIAGVQIALLPLLAIAGREIAGIAGVAVAQSTAMLAATAAQLRLAYGAKWLEAIRPMLRATATSVLGVAAAFAPSFVLTAVVGRSATALLFAVAIAALLTLVMSRWLWREESAVLASLLRRG